jgi:hypothetical protein
LISHFLYTEQYLFQRSYHSSRSKVLRRLRLLLPLLLRRRRRLSRRRQTQEAVHHLENNQQRSTLQQHVDRVLHKAIEAQDKASQQDGSVDVRRQERVVIVKNFDWFCWREDDGRRFRGRDGLDAGCRAHAGRVAVPVVVASLLIVSRGTFRVRCLRRAKADVQRIKDHAP